MEIYVSTDIEANGRIPPYSSMWSFGSVAFLDDGTLVGEFQVNLIDLDGSAGDPETMTWWNHPDRAQALAACRTNPEDPAIAMPRYVQWLKSLPGKPVFVGYPAGYDFHWIYHYLIRFAGESPFSFSALDMKSFAMAVLGTDYRESTKRNFPKSWFPKNPHTHVALDDATEQGLIFLAMLRQNRGK